MVTASTVCSRQRLIVAFAILVVTGFVFPFLLYSSSSSSSWLQTEWNSRSRDGFANKAIATVVLSDDDRKVVKDDDKVPMRQDDADLKDVKDKDEGENAATIMGSKTPVAADDDEATESPRSEQKVDSLSMKQILTSTSSSSTNLADDLNEADQIIERDGRCGYYMKLYREIRREHYNSTSCRARVLSGENVLLEQIFEFARRWDRSHSSSKFFCDVMTDMIEYEFPKRMRPIADFSFNRNSKLNLTSQFGGFNETSGTKIVYFENGNQYCKLLAYDDFIKNIQFKLVVVGPFGDRSNFGPFSGGRHQNFLKQRSIAQAHRLTCPSVPFEDALRVLEHDNLVAWITFQQNMEHPKIVSIPIGASGPFMEHALSGQGLRTSLRTRKDFLLGLTFVEPLYADRGMWLQAIRNASAVLKGKVLNSTVNPWRIPIASGAISQRDAWKEALETPRRSKIVLAPGGLGAGELFILISPVARIADSSVEERSTVQGLTYFSLRW